MIVICIGPVCIPLHMVLAALLGFLHQYGWLTWIKTEWVTIRYWRDRWRKWRGVETPARTSTAPKQGTANSTQMATTQQGQGTASAASDQKASEPGASVSLDSMEVDGGQAALRQRPAAASNAPG